MNAIEFISYVATDMTEDYLSENVYVNGIYIGSRSMWEPDEDRVMYGIVSANADGTERDAESLEHATEILLHFARRYALI